MKKKRNEALSTQSDAMIFSNSASQQLASIGKDNKPTLADAPRLMEMLTSSGATEPMLLEATRNIRRLLSVEKNIPARDLINMGVLPYLVRNLAVNNRTSSVSLIFESAWALTNIASTDCTVDVVQAGAIKPLVHLLDHGDVNIREQCAWCLGNIAGEGPALRDSILQEQPIDALYVFHFVGDVLQSNFSLNLTSLFQKLFLQASKCHRMSTDVSSRKCRLDNLEFVQRNTVSTDARHSPSRYAFRGTFRSTYLRRSQDRRFVGSGVLVGWRRTKD